MGSSGGGTPRPPDYPTPAGPQVPYGQSAAAQPSYTSFLPNDPGAMATGLTPEMIASINAPPAAPPPRMAAGPPQQGGMSNADRVMGILFGRDALAKIMAQRGR